MCIQAIKNLKEVISKKLLDLAEMLPTFNRGPIHILQVIRKLQRDSSDQAYNRSRLPSGCEVEYFSFRLIDFFLVEDLEKLLLSVHRLFPDMEKMEKERLSALSSRAERITSISSQPLGTIGRKKPWFPSRSFRELNELPSEIENIQIGLTQLLPSIFAITFDVRISEVGSQQLLRLYDSKYLPRVVFSKIIPNFKWYWSHSFELGEDAMRREISAWNDRLRILVEKIIADYFRGHFLKVKSRSSPQLPCIETYFINGMMDDGSNFIKQDSKGREWWIYSRGLDLNHLRAFSSENVSFLMADEGTESHKLIIQTHRFGKSQPDDGETSNGSIQVQAGYVIREISKNIALQVFVQSIRGVIEGLRIEAFHTVRPKRIARLFLTPYIKLNDSILYSSMLLDRIATEFEHMKSFYMGSHWIDIELTSQFGHQEEKPTFKKTSTENLEFMIDLLKRHMSLIENWLNQFLKLRNISSTFWLTVVVGLLALLTFLDGPKTEWLINLTTKIAENIDHIINQIFGTIFS